MENFRAESWRPLVGISNLKAQNPDCGTFEIEQAHRHYQRLTKALIQKGWAVRINKRIHLRAYQFVWRAMEIPRVQTGGLLKYKYWKIRIEGFSQDRRTVDYETKVVGGYLKELEQAIRIKIARRRTAQMRHALKEMDGDNSRATFAAKSAASLFGYRSPDTGSKLRTKYFEVIPMTPEEAKPRFNKAHGRFEEPTKQIAL